MEPYNAYERGSNSRGSNSCSMNQYGTCSRNMNNYGSNSRRMGQNSCGENHGYMSDKNRTPADCQKSMPMSPCSCKDNNSHMGHMPVGMAYVPIQQWGKLYDPGTALCEGTAFPDLNLIFCGSRRKM